MLKKFAAVLIIFVLVLGFGGFGCGKKKPQKKPQMKGQQKTVIGVSLADSKDETGKAIQQAMQQSAKNEKDIQLKFSDSGKDSTKQEQEIDKLIQQKPKVIVLQLVDPDTGKDIVRRIMQKNIKVIAIDKLPKNVSLDGYIAPDYTRAGQLAGDYAAKQMVGKPASVLLLQGDTKDNQTQNVTAGVTKSLGGLPVQTLPIPRNDSQLATNQLQQKITAGGIGAIIATNDTLATAAADAVKMQNKSTQITVIGVGGSQKVAQSIKSGDLTAEVDTQPALMGQTAFKAATDLAKTQRWDYERNITNDSSDVPAKMIPVRLVTKDNVFLMENAGKQGGGGGGGSSGGGSSGGSSGGSKSGSSSGSGGSSGGSSGSSGGGGKGGGKGGGNKLMVITRTGRTVEFNVPGTIQRVRVIDVGGQGGSQKLLITTQDGKNLDYLIPDGIMEVETQQAQQGGGQGGGQSGGGGGSSGGGGGSGSGGGGGGGGS